MRECEVNVRNSLMAGSMSGMVAKTMVAPLDRIKILYQVSSDRFTFKKGLHTASSLIQENGYRALWRGNSASLMRVVPYAAIQFSVHEQLKFWFNVRTYEQKLKNPLRCFGAGALAGLAAITCTYPLDVARARMATDNSYRGIYDVMQRAVLSKDYKYGLYRGFLPALLNVVPYTGMSFLIYELFKSRYFAQMRNSNDRATLIIQNILLGSAVSFVGQTIVYPLDIVRRRLQTNVKQDHRFIELFVILFKEQGLRGLFKGISLSWIKLPIVLTSSMGTFDASYYLLNKHFS